ncbi:MAG: pilus assembly protein N-terminal domain-containing protein [Alphaproteobacteria bacterium]
MYFQRFRSGLYSTILLAAITATATSGALSSAFAGAATVVDVTIDEARIVRLKTDAAEIIVGNPAIADVVAQSARLLVVTGKSYGSTNVIALDASGREIYSARLGVKGNNTRIVRLYKGTLRQSLHCAPGCQRTLAIGDDKSQFEQVADTVAKRFSVVQSALGNASASGK